jgi:hypothetical protein
MFLHNCGGSVPQRHGVLNGLPNFVIRCARLAHRFHMIVRAGLASRCDRDTDRSKLLFLFRDCHFKLPFMGLAVSAPAQGKAPSNINSDIMLALAFLI